MRNVERDRDVSIERLLRDALEARPATGEAGPCLDGDAAAAWADETLTRDERSTLEAHVADCARCQALLASIEKTRPVVQRSRWWAPRVAWLVPLTAAAAAVVVWAILPSRTKFEPSERQIAAVNAAATSATPPAQALPEVASKDRSLREEAAGSRTPSPTMVPSPTEARRRHGNDDSQRRAALDSSIDAGRLADGGFGLTTAPRSTADAAASQTAAPSGQRADSLAAPTQALAEAVGVPAEATVPPQSSLEVPPSPAAAPRAVRGGVVGGVVQNTATLSLAKTVPSTMIVSPNLNSRWRIVPNGSVERSTDGGLSWQVQETGVTAALAAGASPSPTVCWLVGRAGVVLLSGDGRSWQRIAFPEMTDLISVRATDDKTAIVTASDGRAFSTTDGGRTWTGSQGARPR